MTQKGIKKLIIFIHKRIRAYNIHIYVLRFVSFLNFARYIWQLFSQRNTYLRKSIYVRNYSVYVCRNS